MTEAELDEIERRAEAAGAPEGLRATRDADPAGPGDAAFVAHARGDVLRLVAAIRAGHRPADAELDAIAARVQAAGPAPWPWFLESDRGSTGCNVILVGGFEHDDEPDLYLWRGDDLASDSDFTFIGAAREDIPRLLEAARLQ